MPAPKTLFELAGATLAPHRLADSAVVMIDAQMEYVTGRLPLHGVDAALKEGAALIEAARKAGRPIVHVQHKGKPGGLFDADSEFFRIAAPVAPKEGEAIVRKAAPNAFAGTDLDAILKNAGAKTLIVAGFMTHMCVSSTVRAALDMGYGCTVLAPACATRDLPDGRGGAVAAGDVHRVELAALSDRFAMIADRLGQLTG
jgi:nicotinamidase-related amidase